MSRSTDWVCPVCTGSRPAAGKHLSTRFAGVDYDYLTCAACRSMSCHPMPTPEALREMYSEPYLFPPGSPAEDAPSPGLDTRLRMALASTHPGVFVDYGCGRGHLLGGAAEMGWKPIGIEFDDKSVERVRGATGFPVYPAREAGELTGKADVLHLGDVLEHLVDPRGELEGRILPLLKPGGLLSVVGPLCEYNLFGTLLTAKEALKPLRRASIPPYHVVLASPLGQRMFFRALGLEEVAFSLEETAWPAPARLALGPGFLRSAALYAARKASQSLSSLAPSRFGNRFSYLGRRPATAR